MKSETELAETNFAVGENPSGGQSWIFVGKFLRNVSRDSCFSHRLLASMHPSHILHFLTQKTRPQLMEKKQQKARRVKKKKPSGEWNSSIYTQK